MMNKHAAKLVEIINSCSNNYDAAYEVREYLKENFKLK